MAGIAALIGIVGAAGVLRAADERTADVERIEGLDSVLADVPDENDESIEYPAENYLLVGSDTAPASTRTRPTSARSARRPRSAPPLGATRS